MAECTRASVSRRPAIGAHRDNRIAAVAQDRCVGRTGRDRAGLSDRASRGRSATIGIGHRVGIRARRMAECTRASVSRRPAIGAHRDNRVAAVAQDRCVGGTGCDRAGLSDRAGRRRRATIGIGHRVGIGACRMAECTRASVSRRPAIGAHRDNRVAAVAQDRCVGRTGCDRAGLSDRAGRRRRATIGIGHRVGIRACSMAECTRASVSRRPAIGAHRDNRIAAVAQNRRVGRSWP